MTIISSQHYIDAAIVDAKVVELRAANATAVVIPCSYVGYIGDEEMALVSDRHHTLAAARLLGLTICFDVSADSEGLDGEQLLDARYNDGDYYRVESSAPENDDFDLVW